MTRVLVIDDDEWLARLFTRRLEHNSMVVQSAPNAIEALDLIDSFRPAVIILDLFMPGPNDITLEQLRPYGVRLLLDKVSMHPDDIAKAVQEVAA